MRASHGLRRRFASRYRGRHHPDDALDWLIDPQVTSRRGTPPPAAPDRTALYRRGSATDGRAVELADRIADAQRAIEQDRTAAEHAVAAVIDASRARRRRASVGGLLVVVVLGASAAFATARQTVADRALQNEAAAAILGSRGQRAPERFFARFPDRLDPGWSHRPSTSATELDGARSVTMPLPQGTTRILLVVACTSADRSYEYDVSSTGSTSPTVHGYGVCGTLRGVGLAAPTGTASVRILVVTRGIDPFALSAYTR